MRDIERGYLYCNTDRAKPAAATVESGKQARSFKIVLVSGAVSDSAGGKPRFGPNSFNCRDVSVATVPVKGFTGLISIDVTEKRSVIMDSAQLAWLIAIIVVVLLILGLALFFGRRWKRVKDHERADTLRQSAAADALNAREGEAKAARAEADAQQAEVDAERLREEARTQTEDAQSARTRAQEQATKAESLDPFTEISGHHRTDGSSTTQDQAGDPSQPEQERRAEDGRDNPDMGVTGP